MKPQNNIVKIGINVFVVKNEKILLGKRKSKRGYGTWCLPGGHLEYNESLIDAAKRELKEETGLRVKKLKLLHIINDPLDESHYIHINFIAYDIKKEPKLTEPNKFFKWKWFDINDVPKNIFIGHKKFIPAYLNKILFIDKPN